MTTEDIVRMEQLASSVQGAIIANRVAKRPEIANHMVARLARLDQIIAVHKDALGVLGCDDYSYLEG